ncbi:MAG: hypothetical protein SFV18_06980 [Bryobacteraceae bacterium]|nr:hypothetical protein [Bryobacteraceae bacterium]
MTGDQKSIDLLQKLADLTESGKLDWETTPLGRFLGSHETIPDFAFLIGPESSQALTVLDRQGQTVSEIAPSSPEIAALLGRVRAGARRVVEQSIPVGLEQVISQLDRLAAIQ